MNLKALIREIIEDILIEGGFVFSDNVTKIPLEHFKPTLVKAMKDAGLTNIKYHPVGNVSKPVLGDIDVAIDFEDLVSKFKSTKDPDDFWKKADVYFKRRNLKDYKINRGLQQIHILTPIIDNKGNPVGGNAQVDLMIGDASFMKDSLGDAKGSAYKTKYRNMFFADIMANTIMRGDGEVQHKFQMNWKLGLQYVRFKMKGKKRERVNIKTVSKNMDDIVSYVFGDKYKYKDVDTFEKMWKAFKSSSFRWKDKRKDIVKSYKSTLTRMKMDIPKEIG